MTKLIVFDWDGTLMDSEARIVACMHAAIADTGLPGLSDDAIRHIIGLGLREALQRLYPDASERDYHDLTRHYREHFLHLNDTPSPLFAGAEALLQKLYDAGYYLAIATGKGRQGLERALTQTGLKDYFHYSRCADETFSKPHPQMLLDIMAWLGVESSETLMIGDTEFDLQMAENAGAKSLAVTHGVHDKTRLLACNPLACVDDLAQMQDWLNQYLMQAA